MITEDTIRQKHERIAELRQKIAQMRSMKLELAQMQIPTRVGVTQDTIAPPLPMDAEAVPVPRPEFPPDAIQPQPNPMIPPDAAASSLVTQQQPQSVGPTALSATPAPPVEEPPGILEKIFNEATIPESAGESRFPKLDKALGPEAMLAAVLGPAYAPLSLLGTTTGRNALRAPGVLARGMVGGAADIAKGTPGALGMGGEDEALTGKYLVPPSGQEKKRQADIEAGTESLLDYFPLTDDIKDVYDVSKEFVQGRGLKLMQEQPLIIPLVAAAFIPGVPGPNIDPKINAIVDPNVNADVNARTQALRDYIENTQGPLNMRPVESPGVRAGKITPEPISPEATVPPSNEPSMAGSSTGVRPPAEIKAEGEGAGAVPIVSDMQGQKAPAPPPIYKTQKGEAAPEVQLPPKAAAGEGQVPPPSAPTVAIAPMGGEAETVGLTKRKLNRQLVDQGLKELDPTERKKITESFNEAEAKGYDTDYIKRAFEVVSTGRPVTDAEAAGFVHGLADLSNEIKASAKTHADLLKKGDIGAAELEARRRESLQEEFSLVSQAGRQGTRLAARVMRIVQEGLNTETYEIAHLTDEFTQVSGRKPKPQEQAQINKIASEHERIQESLKEELPKEAERLKEENRRLAEKVAEYEKRLAQRLGPVTKRKEKLQKSLADIEKQLESKYGMRVTANLDPEQALLLGKYAALQFQLGATNLKEVTARMQAKFPDLTDEDVIDAINTRDPKRQKKAKAETEKHLTETNAMGDALSEVEQGEQKLANPKWSDIKREARDAQRDVDKRKGTPTTGVSMGEFLTPDKAEAAKTKLAAEKKERTAAQKKTEAEARAKVKELEREKTRTAKQEEELSRWRNKVTLAEQGIFDPVMAIRRNIEQRTEVSSLKKKYSELKQRAWQSGMDPERLTAVDNTINDLVDQLDNQYRTLKQSRETVLPTDELQARLDKVKELKRQMRWEDQRADYQAQIDAREFKIRTREKPKFESREVETLYLDLERLRRDRRILMNDAKPMTAGRATMEVINTMRTLKATADMSYTLRQGLILSVRRPKQAAQIFGKAFQAMIDPRKAEQIARDLRRRPTFYLGERAKLYLSDLDGTLNHGEEFFMSRWAEKVPVLKQVVSASERHMVTGLNLLRSAAFDQFVEAYPNATDAELTAWANWVNVATGRGNLPHAAATGLSPILFAPRFSASRVEVLGFKPLWDARKSPRVMKEIGKDYAALYGVGMTALFLASKAGFEVGDDPRSPDFGKIKKGNDRWDIWGGLLPVARLIGGGAANIGDRSGVNILPWTDTPKKSAIEGYDPYDVVTRFIRWKQSPLFGTGVSLWKGKNMVGAGEKMPRLEIAARALLPIILESVWDAYRKNGPTGVPQMAIPEALGVGSQSYEKKKTALKVGAPGHR